MLLSAAHEGLINKVLANKLIVLSNGHWVLPYWREKGRCDTSTKAYAGVLISEDEGFSWRTYGRISHPKTLLIENTLVEVNGKLLMLFRSSLQVIFQSWSHDKGRTWSAARPLPSMPNPDSKVSCAKLDHALCKDGPLVLAFNDHEKGLCQQCRTHLSLAVSTDFGNSWQRVLELEHQETDGLRHHYPTILQMPYGSMSKFRLLVVYSSFFMNEFEKERRVHEGLRVQAVEVELWTNSMSVP
mmetsp:Transcript_49994/g.93110  ORF Transcript_49994/g.93110 Transcript_49994/m.93110 type:complete len:242 (+) Transcript_49994:347-1072(+)